MKNIIKNLNSSLDAKEVKKYFRNGSYGLEACVMECHDILQRYETNEDYSTINDAIMTFLHS